MRYLISVFLLSVSCFANCQTTAAIKTDIDNLKLVEFMPYMCESSLDDTISTFGCGDNYFWSVVKLKEKALPFLIEKIADTAITKTAVPNFGGEYTVGDIAYQALEEIIDGIPTFELLGVEFDKTGCGYCSYWQHLRKKKVNRKVFSKAVSDWFKKNKSKLIWVISNKVLTCDCSSNHPNGGHYEVAK